MPYTLEDFYDPENKFRCIEDKHLYVLNEDINVFYPDGSRIHPSVFRLAMKPGRWLVAEVLLKM